MTPTAEQGAEVRRRLLTAAVELIPERGWSAVSTRMVAERASVSPSVVHYHFASVQALLNEAVLTSMRQVLDEAGARMERVRTSAELLDALIGSVDQYSGTDTMSVLFVEAYLASTRDARLREQLVAVLNDLRARLAAWLTDRGVPEPAATAAVLAASIDGILLHRGLGAGPATSAAADVLHRLVT
ncbi:TetR/AcrR family transcriptional regulator [Kribbella sp. NBC_00709]|uniref:TetR/AcrR family transcriptional regulator n=1 Tax=Kribbella sp. NBC_00709 TaxID=2975972 RepID=UPI002E2CE1F5|nr:TetR/AcrR family transcriptional regulator [Kribbella sp. NBC_00709]